jgi:hypothetical protein
MISHKHKCIFIHIPRCAGTAIEILICGRDWWSVEPSTKHLLASAAKKLYRTWWDDYFKFSIVRDPIDRMISCLKYSDHFGLSIDKFNHMSLEGYYEKFGRDIVIEFDHRFSKREDLITPKHKAGQVYGNILDEEIDFIAKFENFDRDMAAIGARIGLPGKATAVVEHSVNRIDRASLALDSRREIAHLFREDIRRFSYDSE